ncbi:anti-sigma factor RsiW [Marinobacter sp. MBR-99]|uniref:anti-sigma factor family protein n=1 Tax=Marinobacter sp. MBR-99 TaxID=3156461 RepID=UPI003399A3DE
MSCRQIRSQLPEYVRDQLPADESQAVLVHLEDCVLCQQHEAFERSLMSELASRCRLPEPSPGFERRVFGQLPASGSNRKVHVAWGGAVAAALVLGLMLGQGGGTPAPEAEVAAMDLTDDAAASSEVVPVNRTVRLAFNAGEALDDVTLTLDLPPHVELSGLPGQHRVSWQVSLVQGDNVLELPLTILFPGAGELIAELDANGRQKVFRAPVPQYPNGDGSAASGSRQNHKEPAT